METTTTTIVIQGGTEAYDKLVSDIASKVNPPEWIDQEAARKLLGGGYKTICKETLYQLRDTGKIKYKLIGKKTYLYSRSSIIQYLES